VSIRYRVEIRVARRGGVVQWGAARGGFERRLAEQESTFVTGPRIDSESRRGKSYISVTVLMTVRAADVARALDAAWDVFRQAVVGDEAGWDAASATASVRPEP
jgi:hypothetical protein